MSQNQNPFQEVFQEIFQEVFFSCESCPRGAGGGGGASTGDVPRTGKADVVMVFFDVSDKTTLDKAHDVWAKDIAPRRKDEGFSAFLVGSKCDTPEVVRGVSHQTGEK